MSLDPTTATVLVVDDDPFIGSLLQSMLSALGWLSVEVHTSAVDGLRFLDGGNAAALTICDLNMPDVDGIEMLRHLAERAYAGGVIMLTGEDERVLSTSGNLVSIHGLELVGTLQKPIRRDRLAGLLSEWARKADSRPRVARAPFPATEVARAIELGELFNVYQPKVDARSGAFVGIESLVRWRHPTHGTVFPDQFIGVAEDNELIDGLTRLVLTNALADGAELVRRGVDLRVAVNVSMDNLTTFSFADFVIGAIARQGFPADKLILEVTESRLMRDRLAPLDILARLRLKHVSLSIDDFGTGGSSLVQLRDVPFDELKIDRSFIHGAHSDATSRAIVEGSVAMARRLGIKVVAEGVEDADDWRFVRHVGIDIVQGYFVAKPMALEDLVVWQGNWELRREGLV